MVKFLRPSLSRRFGDQVTISFVEITENQVPAEVSEKIQTNPLPLVYFEEEFQFAGTLSYGTLTKYLKEHHIEEQTAG